jgi:hypothetical protein
MPGDEVLQEVRLYVFRQSAETARAPQPSEIATGLGCDVEEIKAALVQLAERRVLILAPNNSNIWAANPSCAVASAFRVRTAEKRYSAICIWDALGVASLVGQHRLYLNHNASLQV